MLFFLIQKPNIIKIKFIIKIVIRFVLLLNYIINYILKLFMKIINIKQFFFLILLFLFFFVDFIYLKKKIKNYCINLITLLLKKSKKRI